MYPFKLINLKKANYKQIIIPKRNCVIKLTLYLYHCQVFYNIFFKWRIIKCYIVRF
jgi:hypothetical protein